MQGVIVLEFRKNLTIFKLVETSLDLIKNKDIGHTSSKFFQNLFTKFQNNN